jgi:hypothetical protein
MPLTPDFLRALVDNPSESLDVELKCWIDPGRPADRALIAKACLALRNHNGGCMLIGFNDDGTPDPNVPANVRVTYHADLIQELCSRHASKPFEVRVEFVGRDGVDYPVICIPSGVESPVAVRSELIDNGRPLLPQNTVYVRTLDANGRVSSAPAIHSDWERVVRTCFDNREADIGAFVRRHLQGANLTALGALLNPPPPDPTPVEHAADFMAWCRERFQRRWEAVSQDALTFGTREASVVLIGDVPRYEANEQFLNELLLRKPKHTGWTPWLDTRHADNADMRANVVDGGWEAFMAIPAGALFGPKIDYWRLEPSGRFYCLRILENDLAPGMRQLRKLDMPLEIGRVAEILSIALSFAQSMHCDVETVQLAVAFRWTNLQERWLLADGPRQYCSPGQAVQPTVMSTALIPLDVPNTALSPWVEQLVRPLFAVFGGAEIARRVIDEITQDKIETRL